MAKFSGAFAAYSEADWRKAAESALKGGAFDRLVSRTADAIALQPLYCRREGPRAVRGESGAWRALARLDHPDAAAANEQAHDDLIGGADGLQVVFAGAGGAYGFGLGKCDSATLHRAFEGVRFDGSLSFELDLGPEAESQAAGFAGLVERSGADPAALDLVFGLDPIGALARSGRAARPWEDEARGARQARGLSQSQGLRQARIWPPTDAAFTPPGERRRRSSPSRSPGRSPICARSAKTALRSTTRRRRSRFA